MADWHPRHLVAPVEWTVTAPGGSEPVAIIRRLRFEGRAVYRAVTWAPNSGGRELIGYYRSGDDAAVAVWRRHVGERAAQHDRASRTHGGVSGPTGTGAPAARSSHVQGRG